MQRLPEEEASAFDAALRDIVIRRMGARRSPETTLLGAELDAFPSPLPVSVARSYAVEMARTIESDWETLRVPALRQNAAALLDRRTVREILAIAEQERERDAERSLAAVDRLAARARTKLQDVERRLSALRADAVSDAAILAGVSVSGQTLMLGNLSGVEEPILGFTLRNETDMHPGRIHFLATVSRGGLAPVTRRAVLAFDIPGGLQRNAAQRHVITMSRLLEETLGGKTDLFQVAVDLAPVAMEDARGRRIGAPDADDFTFARIRSLRDLVARIEAHAAATAVSLQRPDGSHADDPGEAVAVADED